MELLGFSNESDQDTSLRVAPYPVAAREGQGCGNDARLSLEVLRWSAPVPPYSGRRATVSFRQRGAHERSEKCHR